MHGLKPDLNANLNSFRGSECLDCANHEQKLLHHGRVLPVFAQFKLTFSLLEIAQKEAILSTRHVVINLVELCIRNGKLNFDWFAITSHFSILRLIFVHNVEFER